MGLNDFHLLRVPSARNTDDPCNYRNNKVRIPRLGHKRCCGIHFHLSWTTCSRWMAAAISRYARTPEQKSMWWGASSAFQQIRHKLSGTWVSQMKAILLHRTRLHMNTVQANILRHHEPPWATTYKLSCTKSLIHRNGEEQLFYISWWLVRLQ